MRPDCTPAKMRVLNSVAAWAGADRRTRLRSADQVAVRLQRQPHGHGDRAGQTRKGLAREDLFTRRQRAFPDRHRRNTPTSCCRRRRSSNRKTSCSRGATSTCRYNNPAIEPLGEAVPNTELFRRLAKAHGHRRSVFYRTDDEMIEAALDWTHPVLQGITLDDARTKGYARLSMPSADDWAPHREGNFPTPSGKCEFKSIDRRRRQLRRAAVPPGLQRRSVRRAGGSVAALHPAERESATTPALAKRYPLSLISPKSHAFLNSNYGNLPAQTAQARRGAGGDPSPR